jgi:hypothetical protein
MPQPITLSEYYTQKGQALPSVLERAKIYEQQGLGSASVYAGTAEQNTALLSKLLLTPVATPPVNQYQGQQGAWMLPGQPNTGYSGLWKEGYVPVTTVPPVTPPPVTPPPVTPPPVTVPPGTTAVDIQTQITDVQAKIKAATTELEKQNAINDFVKKAAAAGVSYADIQTYIASLSAPAKTDEEIRNEVFTKYGITDLETKAFATPTEDFETIYKRAYTDAGLADIKTKMDVIKADLDKATDDYNTAVGEINLNPWLHEASRLGKIKKVYDMYEAKASRLQNSYTTLSNEYDRGQQRAESVATRALSELEKGQARTKEELSYYIKRAEADIEAQKTLTTTAEEKELLRYFPEYVKAMPEKEGAAELKQLDTGEWAWIYKSGKVVKTGVTGAPKDLTESEKTDLGIGIVVDYFKGVKGPDGFVSPEDWKKAKQAWADDKLAPDAFIKQFYMYINPKEPRGIDAYGIKEADFLKSGGGFKIVPQ